MRIPYIIFSVLFLASCACLNEPQAPLASFGSKLEKNKLTMWGTHYYAHKAKQDSNGYYLYDPNGKAISPKITKDAVCACGIEGTCMIDKIYDYSDSGFKNPYPFTCPKYKGHTIRWKPGKFPFGKGNKSNALEPFVSIAADQSIYKFGTIIHVPQAVGLWLPNGKIHDGNFRVDDVGSAIKGNHLDFFTGTNQEFKFPFVKSNSSRTFEAYVK